MSVDANAWYRALAHPVSLETYVNPQDYRETEKVLKTAEKQLKELTTTKTTADANPPDDVLQRIKQRLNPNARQPRQKNYFVPQEVDHAMGSLQEKLAEYEMQIVETLPIHYGKKVKVKAGNYWAEINIFYGKRGFSVVKTTKTGSNSELADLAATVIGNVLSEW